jgi:hypothetical protein
MTLLLNKLSVADGLPGHGVYEFPGKSGNQIALRHRASVKSKILSVPGFTSSPHQLFHRRRVDPLPLVSVDAG